MKSVVALTLSISALTAAQAHADSTYGARTADVKGPQYTEIVPAYPTSPVRHKESSPKPQESKTNKTIAKTTTQQIQSGETTIYVSQEAGTGYLSYSNIPPIKSTNDMHTATAGDRSRVQQARRKKIDSAPAASGYIETENRVSSLNVTVGAHDPAGYGAILAQCHPAFCPLFRSLHSALEVANSQDYNQAQVILTNQLIETSQRLQNPAAPHNPFYFTSASIQTSAGLAQEYAHGIDDRMQGLSGEQAEREQNNSMRIKFTFVASLVEAIIAVHADELQHGVQSTALNTYAIQQINIYENLRRYIHDDAFELDMARSFADKMSQVIGLVPSAQLRDKYNVPAQMLAQIAAEAQNVLQQNIASSIARNAENMNQRLHNLRSNFKD